MEENKVEAQEVGVGTAEAGKALPTEVSYWTKFKNFLFKEITVELTPKQEKVFKEVRDFWCQEITGEDVKKVLFHEITWEGTKKFWTKKIDITL